MANVSGRLWTGQLTGVGTTAVALSTASNIVGNIPIGIGCREVLVQSDPANTVNILVGVKDAQYLQLTPGQGVTLPISDLSLAYVRASSGSTSILNILFRD